MKTPRNPRNDSCEADICGKANTGSISNIKAEVKIIRFIDKLSSKYRIINLMAEQRASAKLLS
jgi:hypothetical protein